MLINCKNKCWLDDLGKILISEFQFQSPAPYIIRTCTSMYMYMCTFTMSTLDRIHKCNDSLNT